MHTARAGSTWWGAAPISWFAKSGETATDSEVLFYALLLCHSGFVVEQLEDWAKSAVTALEPQAASDAGIKLPDDAQWRMTGSKPGDMLKPMSDAYNGG